MATSQQINVLYVDDEQENLKSFSATFRRRFSVFTASSAYEAKDILDINAIHVLITDQRMPGTLGTELLADAVAKYPQQTRVLLTAYADMEALVDAVNNGQIFKYLTKPWKEEELHSVIEKGYELYVWKNEKIKASEEVQRINEEINSVIKKSFD